MTRAWLRAVTVILAFSPCAFAFSGGATGDSGSGKSTCNDCHTGGKAPTVSIKGAATLNAGDTSTYTITISSATPMGQKFGGIDVSASAGTLVAHPAQNKTKVDSGEIVQDGTAGPFNPLDFVFDFVAPNAPGTVTLFGDGLSADGNGGVSGDSGATTQFMVTIASAGDMAMPPVDLAGLDLAGLDLSTLPDLAEPVDAVSGSTPKAGQDMAAGPKANEPEWGCHCGVARHSNGNPLYALAAIALLAAFFRRRR
jgi:MYXO-CTERM domain-containing protein